MTDDTLRDLAIRITDALVLAGYVPDCTDTNNATEFDVQDLIQDTLTAHWAPDSTSSDS